MNIQTKTAIEKQAQAAYAEGRDFDDCPHERGTDGRHIWMDAFAKCFDREGAVA